MRKNTAVMALLIAALVASAAAKRHDYEEGEREEGRGGEGEEEWRREKRLFMLDESRKVVKTEAGEVRVVHGPRLKGDHGGIHIVFITMEPNSLFIPQYLDACIILFVPRGEMKMGWIYKDDFVEKKLKAGDVNHIPAGSSFYMVNTNVGQQLQVIFAVGTKESLGFKPYNPFYIGGGLNPASVLSGFDIETLSMAYNSTPEALEKIRTSYTKGPIRYLGGKAEPPARLMQMKMREMKERYYYKDDDEDEEEREDSGLFWSWRKMLGSLLLGTNDRAGARKAKGPVRGPDSYNLLGRDPDFRNDFGWSLALDKHGYEPLKYCGIGVYLVSLTAGSMLVPHVNPRASEWGIVLNGSGMVQVGFPNGTLAMSVEVSVGEVFWIPRYFPFCHIASRTGPFVFVGFTTSAESNRPQFLAGPSSVLWKMLGPELAAAYDMTEDELRSLLEPQKVFNIVPTWPLVEEGKPEERAELLLREV